MRKYDTVIFDLDGTLLDTLEDLKNSVNYSLHQYQCKERSLEEIRCFVGNGIRKLIERSVEGGTAHPDFEKIYEAFCNDYAQNCKVFTKPYPGIRELLSKAERSGIKLAIVSNKADFAVKELKQHYFSINSLTAVGEKEGVMRKPAPDMVFYALKEMGCTKERAVYVGDSDVDVLTAEHAEIPCISVAWGFRSREFLEEHGAGRIVSDTVELEKELGL